jgi:hypothetical protein
MPAASHAQTLACALQAQGLWKRLHGQNPDADKAAEARAGGAKGPGQQRYTLVRSISSRPAFGSWL